MIGDVKVSPGKDIYFVVVGCPLCGRRVRASQVCREFAAHPKPSFDDAQAIVTISAGPKKLSNVSSGLIEHLKTLPYRERSDFGRRISEFFVSVERRLLDASREARGMSSRVRIL